MATDMALTGSSRLDSSQRKSSGGLRIRHEPFPHVTSAQVLGAQECDPRIDADHIVSLPTRVRVEDVNKTIASIDLGSKTGFDGVQRRQADVRSDHQGTCGGTGDDRPVPAAGARWAAPRLITTQAVGTRDAPDVGRVRGKLTGEIHAERTVRAGGRRRNSQTSRFEGREIRADCESPTTSMDIDRSTTACARDSRSSRSERARGPRHTRLRDRVHVLESRFPAGTCTRVGSICRTDMARSRSQASNHGREKTDAD